MKIYRTNEGIVIENEEKFFLIKNEDWGEWINDDNLLQKATKITTKAEAGGF